MMENLLYIIGPRALGRRVGPAPSRTASLAMGAARRTTPPRGAARFQGRVRKTLVTDQRRLRKTGSSTAPPGLAGGGHTPAEAVDEGASRAAQLTSSHPCECADHWPRQAAIFVSIGQSRQAAATNGTSGDVLTFHFVSMDPESTSIRYG